MSTDAMNRSAPADSPAAEAPRLGEYRLLREVGRGAMGVVYEAVQESLGRRVALKVLPPGLAVRGAFLERFRREAQVAGRLHHTNIVPVHGSGEQDGSYFYAMQFIQGHGLDAVLEDVRRLRGLGAAAAAGATSVRGALSDAAPGLRGGGRPGGLTLGPAPTVDTRLPAARGRDELVGPPGPAYYRGVARLGLQAAEALAYAHGQGVLHRDVKPSNLLIDHQGILWVSDFGLAKADGGGDLTEVNDLVGTLRYMAPERFQGRADGRSDVYSLGATLYEMLTLRPAFEETDRLQIIARVTQHAPPPPRQWAPDAPRDLETIVLKAMAREPADRYATAAALAEDLRRFLDDRLILARRASVVERLRRWRRRSPATAALALSVAALLLLLAAGSTVAALGLAGANDKLASTNTKLTDANDLLTSANAQLGKANDDLERLDGEKAAAYGALKKSDAEKTEELWRSLYGRARAGRFSPRPGRRLDSLDALTKAWRVRPDDRLRTEAIACLALTDLRPQDRWHPCLPDTFDMDFDDDLGRYVCADRHGNASVRRTAGDDEIAAVSTGFDAPSWVEMSRDGRFVTVRPDGDGGRLQAWDLDGAPDRPPVRRIDEQSRVSCTAFSPDGRRLVVGYTDGRLVAYDLTTGAAQHTLSGKRRALAAAAHPDGRRLAVANEGSNDNEGFIQVYDLDSENRVGGWKTGSPMEALAWGPDSRLLATVGRDQHIYVWDAATGRRTAVMEGPNAGGIRIAFSHGGDVLAGRDVTGLLRLWDPRTGRQLFSTAADMRALRFSADDGLLAGEVNGDKVGLWEVAVGREYRTLAAEPVSLARPDFSGSAAIHPTGRLLAAAMSDGVRLWDLAGGDQCAFLGVGPTVAVAFDAAGALEAVRAAKGERVLRWSVSFKNPEELEIGPSEALPLRGAGAGLACGRQVQLTAVATLGGAEVFNADDPKQTVTLRTHDDLGDDVRDVSMSADGRWVATCSHSGRGVRVWETATRAVAKEIPVEGAAGAAFSPDGRWLAVGGADACQVFAVEKWDAVRRIEGAASAFSPDGGMLAVTAGPGIIRLVDPQTGKEIARLEDPNQDRGESLFTPDGAGVVVVSRDGRCVHVWDLRRIRDDLRKLGPGMEGGLPDYPPAPDMGKPLQVTVKGPVPPSSP